MDTVKLSFGIWVNKKDPFFEAVVVNCNRYQSYFANKAVEYCRKVLKSSWPQAEKLISSCPMAAYKYSRFVLKKRWPKGENSISKSSDASYLYARFVLKDRFKIGEKSISRWNNDSYLYAKHILKGRFQISESNIAESSYNAKYAVNCLKKRWKKAENGILEYSDLKSFNQYIEMLKGKDRINFHNKIIALGIKNLDETSVWKSPTWKLWIRDYGDNFIREKNVKN